MSEAIRISTRPVGHSPLEWIAVCVAGALAQWVLWSVSEPGQLFSDFYKAYYPIAEYLWVDGPSSPWPLEEVGAGSSVNLPIVGWLFAPFVVFGEAGAGWAFFALGVAATAGAWFLIVRWFAPEHGPLLLLLFLINGPLVNSLREGNCTHEILLLLVIGLRLWRTERNFAAGIVFGICAIIKLPLLLIGVYFFVRGRWTIVIGGAAAIVCAVLLSLIVHGFGVNADWYRDSIEPFLGGVIPAFNVQSIDGFLVRLFTGTDGLLDWTPHRPSVVHKVIRLTAVALLLGGMFFLMRRAGRTRAVPVLGALSRREIVEFSLVLMLSLAISPISWSHYYLLLLLPIALHLGGFTVVPGKGWRMALWIGFALTSLPVIILPSAPDWPGEIVARGVVSFCLLGGLLVLAAHARALWQVGSAERPASS